jgi:hypothetical protein
MVFSVSELQTKTTANRAASPGPFHCLEKGPVLCLEGQTPFTRGEPNQSHILCCLFKLHGAFDPNSICTRLQLQLQHKKDSQLDVRNHGRTQTGTFDVFIKRIQQLALKDFK